MSDDLQKISNEEMTRRQGYSEIGSLRAENESLKAKLKIAEEALEEAHKHLHPDSERHGCDCYYFGTLQKIRGK